MADKRSSAAERNNWRAIAAESVTAPWPYRSQSRSQRAPAQRTSSQAAWSKVPLQTNSKLVGSPFARNSAVARKFRKEPTRTALARAQARSARVPFVVVMTMVRPPTFSRVNSWGELPRSNSILPVRSAWMRTPPRSPASKTSGRLCFRLSASGISTTGIIAAAPLARAVTMVLVARRTSKTTQTIWPRSSFSRAVNSAGVKMTSRGGCTGRVEFAIKTTIRITIKSESAAGKLFSVSRLLPPPICLRSHIMKEVLLRVASMGTEMDLREALQPPQVDAAAGKVKLTKRLQHPYVHRESGRETVSEEQDAIGDLTPNTRQLHQLGARDLDRQLTQANQIKLAARDGARGRQQVRGAEAHFADAQLGFGGSGQPGGRGEGVCGRLAGRHSQRVAVAFAEQQNDLLDLNDLLGGRKDERRQTFPRVLTQQAQPATGADGGAHRRVLGERLHDLAQVQVDLQVVCQP